MMATSTSTEGATPMGINVQVRTERGEVREQLVDPHNVIAHLIHKAYAAQFPYLRHVDSYGNTYFNNAQLEEVVPELRHLSELADTEEESAALEEVERLALICRNAVHLYLVFAGD